MTRAETDAHRRTGSLRAQRALKRSGVDFDSPIDVFGAIERERVWLLFQPLDHLYGAYRRHDTPGIVVHAGHPLRLQRFTAAHELGHHLLGHELSVDARDEVERLSGALPAQEIEAQAFAATYLMPVQLVNRALSRVGLERVPGAVEPADAYRLSLELGASYTATVTQLRALERITQPVAQALLKTQPIDIKSDLALGHRPANARAEVWALTQEDHGRSLWVSTDDEIHARLPETPSTGYRWRPSPGDPRVEVAGDEPHRDPQAPRLYGSTRERHLWWRALAPTDTAVGAQLRRSFEPEDGATGHFEVALHVTKPPIDAEQGVSRRQLQLL